MAISTRSRAQHSKRRRFITPEGVDLQIELASASARAGALMLDLILILVILIVLFIACMSLVTMSPVTAEILWDLGSFFLFNFWFIVFEMGSRGATLGKRIVGLRVIARDGARLTGGAIIMRNVMRLIEIVLPLAYFFGSVVTIFTGGDVLLPLLALAWSMIFLFFPLFNRDRLRVGDLLAGTWVVHRARAQLGHDLAASAAQSTGPRRVFSDAQLDLYGIYELQTLEEVLRGGHTDAIVTVAAAIRRKGDMPDDGDDYGFLSDYYAALCGRLERGMMIGLRREDKYSKATRAA
jgi:uncharacterized RDD family membrane protein YckC